MGLYRPYYAPTLCLGRYSLAPSFRSIPGAASDVPLRDGIEPEEKNHCLFEVLVRRSFYLVSNSREQSSFFPSETATLQPFCIFFSPSILLVFFIHTSYLWKLYFIMKFQTLLGVFAAAFLACSSIAAPAGGFLSERVDLNQEEESGLDRRAGSSNHVTGTQVLLYAVEQHLSPSHI